MADAVTSAVYDVVVVGAGIAGLAVAHDVAAAGRSVVVLEAGDQAGGLLRRAELDGVSVDVGAESFALRTTGGADLIADAGLDLRIVAPAPGGAHLVVTDGDGLLRAPLPERAVLGIPADPLADDVVRILGPSGAARAAAEVIPDDPDAALEADDEPSLAELVARRCGPVLVDRLVDPLCRSVYSVPASQVRMSRLHPALWREFRARGSLLAAADAVAGPARAGSAVAGIEGGMWRLADALARAAERKGAELRLGAAVRRLSVNADGTLVDVAEESGAAQVMGRRIVIATGSAAARMLLGAPAVASPAVRVVVALVDSPELDAHPVGYGVIVGADVATAAKALTHVTAKWPWTTTQAPSTLAGRHVVRLSARDAHAHGLDTPDDVAREVSVLTGAAVEASAVSAVTTVVWDDAVAARPVDADREDFLARRGILLAGAAVAGTGLASVVPHARALARDLVEELHALADAPTTPPAPTSRRTA
jgi:oxygen-dependent protoporphyrinogen oxidase